MKRKDDGIGFTTVYRTLKLLAECDLASEVAFNDGITRYEHQYQRRNHHHMVCTECDSSVEFFSPEIERIEQEIGRKNKYFPPATASRFTASAKSARRKTSAPDLAAL